MKSVTFPAFLLFALIVFTYPAQSAEKIKPVIDNNWGSKMVMIDKDTMRVTTKKRISGDLDEINEPGTSMYQTFQRIQAASLLRTALESKNLGYGYFVVSGVRNVTSERERTRVTGEVEESDFTFAPGHYSTEVDLGIEVTTNLYKTQEELPSDESYYSVAEILAANGLTQ